MGEVTKWYDSLLGCAASDDARQAVSVAELSAGGVEKYFRVLDLACDEVSGSMTGAEIVGACRETAVQAMHTLLQRSSAPFLISRPMAEGLLHSLMQELEAALREKTPLLSN